MKDYFGLDIGADSVKIVQLASDKQKIKLVAAAEVKTPPDIVESDSPANQKQLSAFLKSLMSATKLKTVNVVAALPSSKITTQIFDFPSMPKEELEFAMKYESRYRIKDSLNELVYDWQNLNEAAVSNFQIYLAATPKYISGKYQNIIRDSGLKLLALDTEPLSLINSLTDKEKSVLILHGGERYTLIVQVDRGVLKRCEVIPVGGSYITDAIASELGVGKVEAENFKSSFGLEQNKMDGHVYKEIKRLVDDHIIKTINDFEKSAGPIAQVSEKIIISGGLALMPRLDDYLTKETSKKVTVANPWSGIDCTGQPSEKLVPVAPKFSLAVGLALTYIKA